MEKIYWIDGTCFLPENEDLGSSIDSVLNLEVRAVQAKADFLTRKLIERRELNRSTIYYLTDRIIILRKKQEWLKRWGDPYHGTEHLLMVMKAVNASEPHIINLGRMFQQELLSCFQDTLDLEEKLLDARTELERFGMEANLYQIDVGR